MVPSSKYSMGRRQQYSSLIMISSSFLSCRGTTAVAASIATVFHPWTNQRMDLSIECWSAGTCASHVQNLYVTLPLLFLVYHHHHHFKTTPTSIAREIIYINSSSSTTSSTWRSTYSGLLLHDNTDNCSSRQAKDHGKPTTELGRWSPSWLWISHSKYRYVECYYYY